MTVSPPASAAKVQTALDNLGTPNGFLGRDTIPLLQQLVVALGNVTGGGGSSAITGEGKLWFTDTAPTGWLICDGSAVSRTTYADLFAVIGTTYGAGDGSTTFGLPNLSGRVPAGMGGIYFPALGDLVGVETHTISQSELPEVNLTSSVSNVVQSSATDEFLPAVGQAGVPINSTSSSITVPLGGGSLPFSIIQPSLVVNFIIKT